MDRNSAWSTYQVQDPQSYLYNSVWWHPALPYQWKHPKPFNPPDQSDKIYEAHVGMAQEEGKVSTYREFADHNLDRIVENGYNII